MATLLVEGYAWRFDEIDGRMQMLHADLLTRIQEGDNETRRYMRVLHEEVLARIAALGDGRKRRNRS